MENSNAEFTPEEQAELKKLEQESLDQPLPVNDYQANPPTDEIGNASEATAAPAENKGTGQTTTNDKATDPPKTDDKTTNAKAEERSPGDLRQALRASRNDTRNKQREIDRLAAEIEALRNKVKPEPTADLTEDELGELEVDNPAAARAYRAQKARVDELAAQRPTTTTEPAKAGFVPAVLDEATQDLVDDIPELFDWQHNPDQTGWSLACQADALLQKSPLWAGKPDKDRLAEATRLAKSQLSKPSDPPQRTAKEIAAERVANAPELQPTGVRDIPGGSKTQRTQPDYSRMTDDEIMSSIPEG